MTGFAFCGGRPPETDEERFASGYREGIANVFVGRMELWRALGLTAEQHAERVPVYHAGMLAGAADARDGAVRPSDELAPLIEDAWIADKLVRIGESTGYFLPVARVLARSMLTMHAARRRARIERNQAADGDTNR